MRTKGGESDPGVAGLPARFFLAVLTLTGGFHVMLLELCAFRVLQTAFGASVYVTGILLALVMAALALGYALGGWFSRTFGSLAFLLGTLCLAIVAVNLFGVWLSDGIIDGLYRWREGLFDRPVLAAALPAGAAALVLYALPMTVLAQIAPYVVRLLSKDQSADELHRTVGATAGSLMALSTAGSIAGTLATSFLLIPWFGIRETLLVFAVSTMVLVTIGGVFFVRPGPSLLLAAVAALVSFATHLDHPGHPVSVVFAAETAYGHVEIEEKKAAGQRVLLYKPSRFYVHSRVYPDEPLRGQLSLNYVSPGLASRARRYLVLGVAGGGAIRQILTADKHAHVTGVDVDPASLRIATDFFGVPADETRVDLIASDARIFLRETDSTWDYVVVNLFAGEQIPVHCVTVRFFELVARRLQPGGTLFVNSNMPEVHFAPQGGPAIPLHHLHATLRRAGFDSMFQSDVFGTGSLLAFQERVSKKRILNDLRRGAQDRQRNVHVRASLAGMWLRLVSIPRRPHVRPFTDDWAPESLLHLKGNVPARIRSLSRRVSDGGSLGDSLAALTRRHVSRYWRAEGAFSAYGEEYCPQVAAWMRRHDGGLRLALARNFVWPACVPWFVRRGRPPGTTLRFLHAYSMGLFALVQDQGERALPLLRDTMPRIGES